MKVVIVVAKNLLDVSKIKDASRALAHDVVTCSDTSRIHKMFQAGPGDRQFVIVVDYAVYEKGDLDVMRYKINEVAEANRVTIPLYRSFVPHEKIEELQRLYRDVDFVPRSKFFKNLSKYLS